MIEIHNIDDLADLAQRGDVDALAHVRKLHLDEAGLTTLPDWLGDLTGVEEIHLDGQLPNLQKLDLRWNKLSSVPPWIWQLKQHGCTVYR